MLCLQRINQAFDLLLQLLELTSEEVNVRASIRSFRRAKDLLLYVLSNAWFHHVDIGSYMFMFRAITPFICIQELLLDGFVLKK